MNSVNASTGFSAFQLHIGRAPKMIPPLIEDPLVDNFDVHTFLTHLQHDVLEAHDNLTHVKALQAASANRRCGPDPLFQIDNRVLVSTKNRRWEYLLSGSKRIAKFTPRFDGPYRVIHADHATSTYTLKLPPTNKMSPTFHASQLCAFIANDGSQFPA